MGQLYIEMEPFHTGILETGSYDGNQDFVSSVTEEKLSPLRGWE